MSADTSVVKPVEAPPLTPLALKSKLAATPSGPPKYSVKVRNAAGAEVTLADPRATRALVALMDVHAVVGGAAVVVVVRFCGEVGVGFGEPDPQAAKTSASGAASATTNPTCSR